MLNDPPPERRPAHPLEQPPAPSPETIVEAPQPPKRRPHPLEVRPAPVEPSAEAPQQRAMLHIPASRPYLTYALVILIVGIFALGYVFPRFDLDIKLWGMNMPRQILLFGEYHRLLTAMFLHADLAHIMFNALVLYSFGAPLERIMGHVRFGLIYLLGGLAGSVLSTALHSGSNTPSLGASGAIFALLGAEYIFLHKHRKLLGANGEARRRSLVVIGAMNLALGVLTSIGDGPVRIDNWGHLGGLIGGLVLAWFISPDFILRRHPNGESLAFIAEDTNPLRRKYWVLSLYSAALLLILIVAALIVRS